jgi:threonine/homoserine/homoserine lactone efflux protein
MVTLLAIGFVLGAVISIPLGALGAFMINRTIRDGLWAGLSVGLWSAAANAFCCGISLGGLSLMTDIPLIRVSAQGAGLAFLIFVGARYLFSSHEQQNSFRNIDLEARVNRNKPWNLQLQNLIIVVVYTVVNPTSLAFWANMASLLHSSILRSAGINEFLAFSGGVGIGSAFSQYVSLILVREAEQKFASTRTTIRRASIIIFLATNGYFSYSLAREIVNLI